MTRLLQHRGPDDEGFYNDDHIYMGHRRLSIIDLEHGHQPIPNEDKSLWLIFNGEIYNYIELQKELSVKGHNFNTNCDSETILHAYEEWGDDCVKHFNGMWAFAVWDTRNKKLFASRDRFGIKPFYYYVNDKQFIFSSEIKAIFPAKTVKPEINPAAFADYFSFLYVIGSKTFFKNIYQLLPGHSLTYDVQDNMHISKYWDFPVSERSTFTPIEENAENLLAILKSSVKLRLRSDVPVGCYLSGGIDSSSVSSLAAEQSESRIKAFTALFEEGGIYDESPYARELVRKYNLEGVELKPNLNDFWDVLPNIIWHLDQPFEGPQIFPKFRVAECAAKHVKVCLGGQGGDEMFVGYPRYLMSFLENQFSRFNFGKNALEAWFSQTSMRSKCRFILDFLSYKKIDDRFLHFAAITKGNKWNRSLSPDFIKKLDGYSPVEEYRKVFNENLATDSLAKLQQYEFKTFLQGLLHVEDRVSMAWGLESRLPMLDYRVAEFLFRLSPQERTNNYQLKGLLKLALKNHLPPAILNRKDKLGFPTPFRTWASSGLSQKIRSLLIDGQLVNHDIIDSSRMVSFLQKSRLSDMEGLTLWAMIAGEIWLRVFITGNSSTVNIH